MGESALLNPELAQQVAVRVRATYDAAVAQQWQPIARDHLWNDTVEAVLLYLNRAASDPGAMRYYHLLVDLSVDCTAEQITTWPDATLRAARLAATHTLQQPSAPQHRPRAQALLKRLDLVQNPLLQARERMLLLTARQQQALRDSGGDAATRRPEGTTETGMLILRRITAAVRAMPALAPDSYAASTVLAHLRELYAAVEHHHVLEPMRLGSIFESLQRVWAAEKVDLPLGPALSALEAIRLGASPAVRTGRQALIALVFELVLSRYARPELPALNRHLEDLARIAHNLAEIPPEQLSAILFRLRQRLADPANPAVEKRIDDALSLLGRLEQRREAVLAKLARAESTVRLPEEQRSEIAAARNRLAEIDSLIEALHQVTLSRLTPAEASAIPRLMAHLEALSGVHNLDAETFNQELFDLMLQLERPFLATHALWNRGRQCLHQLVAQRRLLEEQARGIAVDRHLDTETRKARQQDFTRRLTALDQARVVLGSLPYERVPAAHMAEPQQALDACMLGLRAVASGADSKALRTALDRLSGLIASES